MSSSKRGTAWMHCTEVVEGNGVKVKCNYCSKVVTGITRFKQHLAIEGTDVTACPNVPSEVSEEMRNNLGQLQQKRATTTWHLYHASVPLHNDARPDARYGGLNSQGQNPPPLERPATRWITSGGPMTRPGGTIPLGAVNQLPGYYVQSPQGPNPLGLMMTRSARAVTLPSIDHMVRPNGTSSQNQPCHLQPDENIFWFPQLGPVYHWINGFWHGPFYEQAPVHYPS